ncbi:MAG: peptidase, partial [Clostridia bacterium]|nr:peptidase [Clostridia bacterium]
MNAVINTPICPLMSHPASRCELADEALYGMTVVILNQPDAGWYNVRTHYGYTGYVAEEHLLFGEPEVGMWDTCIKRVVLHKNTCDILAQPTVQSWPLLSLTRGALLHPVGEQLDGWQKVRLCDGREGYK